MQIDVLLFAAAREAAGAKSIRVDVPSDASAADVLRSLGDTIPGIQGLIPSCRLAVDNDYVTADHPVSGASEIALIPPVSGG